MSAADHAPADIFIRIIVGAGYPAAVIVFGAAPNAAAVFSEHPCVEGGVAVKLEMQGAPPAQASCAGKRFPATGPGHVPGDGDLQRGLGGSAAATVCLKP